MNDRRLLSWLWVCALVVFILGVWMTIQSWRRFDRAALRLERKLGNLAQLHAKERELNRYEAARRAFERLPEKSPDSPSDLINIALSGHQPDDIREFRRPSVPGWTVRQKEIVFNEVPLDKVAAFLHMAETGSREQRRQSGNVTMADGKTQRLWRRPPWRLVKCVIRVTSGTTGWGQVTLLMEALEKKETSMP